MKMQAHLFVDNSNLIGGAQRVAWEKERAPWPAVRIFWRNFFEFIESDYLPATRVFAGSLPPGNDDLWDYARRHGYDTSLLHRIPKDNGHLGEQAVDEVMHVKIAGVLLDYDPPQTLILVTGDGNSGEFGTSFLQQVQRALKRKWKIHVISWECQLSRKFKQLAAANSDSITVIPLETVYDKITFLNAGDFTDADGSLVQVARRNASSF